MLCTVIGRDCKFGENVNLKDCVIGNHCQILDGAKLNRCVLMDSVTVGSNCTIQNSILCHNSMIQDNCNLNNCQVSYGAKVSKGSRLINEAHHQDRYLTRELDPDHFKLACVHKTSRSRNRLIWTRCLYLLN
mmetsp:Transcript_10983/g.13293  ORF Transcript_10983/g.13293 Transcript_10983/m.13293 type:complete len:132 (+) Transcript_10983:1282-1677(+)